MQPIAGLGLRRLVRVVSSFAAARALLAAKTAFGRSEESASDERLPAVFQPEGLLPVQYYETLRRKHELRTEKLLMFAVLEDAVQDYMKYLSSSAKKGQQRFREAEDWINTQNKLGLFSFDNVCEALDIDPEYMRRGLHQWKKAHLEHRQQPP